MLREFFFSHSKVFFVRMRKPENVFKNEGKKSCKIESVFCGKGRNNEKERISFLSLVSLKNFWFDELWWALTRVAEISSLPLFFKCLHLIKVQEVLKVASRQLPLDKDLHFKQIRCFHLLNLLPPARPKNANSRSKSVSVTLPKDSNMISLFTTDFCKIE